MKEDKASVDVTVTRFITVVNGIEHTSEFADNYAVMHGYTNYCTQHSGHDCVQKNEDFGMQDAGWRARQLTGTLGVQRAGQDSYQTCDEQGVQIGESKCIQVGGMGVVQYSGYGSILVSESNSVQIGGLNSVFCSDAGSVQVILMPSEKNVVRIVPEEHSGKFCVYEDKNDKWRLCTEDEKSAIHMNFVNGRID